MSQTCTCLTCGRTEHNQLLVWNKCEQCQRIEYLESEITNYETARQEDAKRLEQVSAEREAMERVAKIAKIIFDVTTVASIRTKQIACPHGNIPMYPTHAWWCDKCFWELEEALEELEALKGGKG